MKKRPVSFPSCNFQFKNPGDPMKYKSFLLCGIFNGEKGKYGNTGQILLRRITLIRIVALL